MNPICGDRRRQRVGFQNPNGPAYDVVLSMCSSLAQFPAPWQNVPPPVDARGPILDGAVAIKELARQFTPEMLHDAGILRQAPDGSDELAPELVNRTGAILPLRYAANGQPMDLLSAGGCLALAAHPLEDVLRDHWTRNRIAESGLLIATPNIHDVLLLRALGFPATCTAGMATVARPEAKAMIDDLNGVNVSAAWPARCQLDLILPTWQVARMDERPPDGLTDIATRLAALQGDLNLALFAVSAWTTDARRLASLRLAVDMCSPADLSTLLAGSMTTERFADTYIPADGPPVAYGAALAELLDALGGASGDGHARRRRCQARGMYDRAIQADLIGPLQAAALTARSATARDAQLQLASISTLLHRLSPEILDLERRGAMTSPPARRRRREYLQAVRAYGRLLPKVAGARRVDQ